MGKTKDVDLQQNLNEKEEEVKENTTDISELIDSIYNRTSQRSSENDDREEPITRLNIDENCAKEEHIVFSSVYHDPYLNYFNSEYRLDADEAYGAPLVFDDKNLASENEIEEQREEDSAVRKSDLEIAGNTEDAKTNTSLLLEDADVDSLASQPSNASYQDSLRFVTLLTEKQTMEIEEGISREKAKLGPVVLKSGLEMASLFRERDKTFKYDWDIDYDRKIKEIYFGNSRDYLDIINGQKGVAVDRDGEGKALLYRIEVRKDVYAVYVVSPYKMQLPSDSSYMFAELLALNILDTYMLDTSNVTSMESLFYRCESLTTLDLSGWSVSNVTDMSDMFSECRGLTKLDLSAWDVSHVTSMKRMFYDCADLKTLDLSGWNTSRVTSMESLFYRCESLTTLDLFGWDVSNVTSMKSMFSGCADLKTLDLSRWNTSGVWSMTSMFSDCRNLINLDLSAWDASHVTSMDGMFYNCMHLTALDLSAWNVHNVTDMRHMFSGCADLETLDLFGWDVSHVTSAYALFSGCKSLKTIIASDWTSNDWTSNESIKQSDDVFTDCQSLVGAIVYNSEKTSGAYCSTKTGYFTLTEENKKELKRLRREESLEYLEWAKKDFLRNPFELILGPLFSLWERQLLLVLFLLVCFQGFLFYWNGDTAFSLPCLIIVSILAAFVFLIGFCSDVMSEDINQLKDIYIVPYAVCLLAWIVFGIGSLLSANAIWDKGLLISQFSTLYLFFSGAGGYASIMTIKKEEKVLYKVIISLLMIVAVIFLTFSMFHAAKDRWADFSTEMEAEVESLK